MKCPKCNKTYDDDFKFCPYCGEETPELKYCYECLYKSREFIFCPECGTTLLPKEETIKTILNIIDGPFLVHITGDPTAETLVHVEQCVEQAKNYKKLINLDPKAEYVYNYLVYLNKIYEVDPFTLINGEEFNPKKLIQNKEEILDIINKTLETYPRNGDYLFLKGRYLEIVGECEEAITYYENARHSIMENYFEELSRDYIKLLEKLGKYGGLLKLYDNLIVDSRTSTDTRRQYISNKEDLLEEFKRYDELFEFYNFLIEIGENFPEQTDVLIRKGHLLERFKRYDEALELYLKFDLYYDAIDLLVKLEKYDTALKLSHSERFHYKEIRILKKLERYDELLELYENLLKDEDLSAYSKIEYLKDIINILEKLERYDEEIIYLNRLLDELNENQEERINYLKMKGKVLEKLEKYDDAVKFYHEHGLYHDEITILEKLERYDELLELYENLLKHEDFDVKSEEGYLCEIIKVLDKLEKMDKSEEYIQRLITLNKELMEKNQKRVDKEIHLEVDDACDIALFTKDKVYESIDILKSVKKIEAVKELSSGLEKFLFHAVSEMGAYDIQHYLILELYDALLDLDSENPEYWEHKGMFLESYGEPEEAKECYKKYEELSNP